MLYIYIQIFVKFGETNVYGFTIYLHGGHLGHVAWTNYINFSSLDLRIFHMKVGLIGQVISEKSTFFMKMAFGHFLASNTRICTINCLYLSTFRS